MKSYECRYCGNTGWPREKMREHVKSEHPEWKESYTVTDGLGRDPLQAHIITRKVEVKYED